MLRTATTELAPVLCVVRLLPRNQAWAEVRSACGVGTRMKVRLTGQIAVTRHEGSNVPNPSEYAAPPSPPRAFKAARRQPVRPERSERTALDRGSMES